LPLNWLSVNGNGRRVRKGRRQKEKGRSYLLARHPNFFILPFAFLLLPYLMVEASSA
jgi:hypothetical protein